VVICSTRNREDDRFGAARFHLRTWVGRASSRPTRVKAVVVHDGAWPGGSRRRRVFIGVGNAVASRDGHADLSYVYAATKTIAEALEALRSSSINRRFRSAPARGRAIIRSLPDADFASCQPRGSCAGRGRSRISSVPTGGDRHDDRRARVMSRFRLEPDQPALHFVGRRTSELTKRANAFLATKSPSSMRSRFVRKNRADVRMSPRGSGGQVASATFICTLVPVYGGSAFPRHAGLLKNRAGRGRPCGSSRRCSLSTTRVNAQWRARSCMLWRLGARQARRLLGLASSPIPTTCRSAPSLAIVALARRRRGAVHPTTREHGEAAAVMPEAVVLRRRYARSEGADAL